MEKISLTAIQWGILVIFLISAVIAAPNVSESQKTNNQVPPATSSNASTSSTTATPDNKSQGNSTDQVIIYFTFLEIPYTLDVTGCTGVPSLMYKKTRSLDPQSKCYTLYGRENCQGRKVTVSPTTLTSSRSNLQSVDFVEELVSLKPCDRSTNTTITSLIVTTKGPSPIPSTSNGSGTSSTTSKPAVINSKKGLVDIEAKRDKRSATSDVTSVQNSQNYIPDSSHQMNIINQPCMLSAGNLTKSAEQSSRIDVRTSSDGSSISAPVSSDSGNVAGIQESVISQARNTANSSDVSLTNVIY